MVAFPFRMGAGFAGDVNRSHPASIEPNVNDATNPVAFFGAAGVYSATGSVRSLLSTDTALTMISGICVRQFPTQQMTASANYGEADLSTAYNSGPGSANALDLLKSGYIMVPVIGSPIKGGVLYVWVAATGGGHVQGGFEATATGGSTIAIGDVGKTYFNSAPDAYGICEIAFNV